MKCTPVNPHIVCIGGGTGLSTMLRGIKRRTANISAIVTVADDGGGSGMLRSELGMPPPGDIRNCIQALSGAEPALTDLIGYRFDTGRLKGQSFGNLLLAAMNGIYDSFDEAVSRMGDVLNITGQVLPVTNENVYLVAEFQDGSEVVGESKILEAKLTKKCDIRRVRLVPSGPTALSKSIRAIEGADIIVLGPGSLYTSIIPNLLVDGIVDAIAKSDAMKVYICNIMTQQGETEGYTVADHIEALFDHAGCRLFDYCLVNNELIETELLHKYAREGAAPVMLDKKRVEALGVEAICAPMLVQFAGLIRHEPGLLADEILRLYVGTSPTKVYDR